MLCKECGVNPAKPSYRGRCTQCHHKRYDYSKGRTCPDCGKPVTNTHTLCPECAAHARQKSADGTCKQCKRLFVTKPPRKILFCSKDCYDQWRVENLTKDRSRICDWCGKVYQYSDKNPKQRFCSKSCGDAGARRMRGEKHPLYKEPVNLTCVVCGKAFQRKPCQASGERCCSKKCRHTNHSDTMTGENNPNWKGGFAPYYGPNWDRQRRKALKRADYRCEYCGKTSAENGREVAIHHMKPLRTFGYIPGENENYLAANHLDNLIALCDVCHGRAEHGSISVSR